jgi:ABC-type amino acid transport substrate-binding protein
VFPRLYPAVVALLLACTCTASDTLLVVGEAFPPFKFLKDGHPVGIDIDVDRVIFERLGVKYEFQVLPWTRCWEYLKQGDADVGMSVSNTHDPEDRSLYVRYPKNAVWTSRFVFFTNRDTQKQYAVNGFDDAKKSGLRVGIVNGNSYSPVFWTAFPWKDAVAKVPNDQLEVATTMEMNLRKLDAGRIGLYPIDRIIGTYTSNLLNLKNITHYDSVLFSKPYPNVFSKKSKFQNDHYPNIQSLMRAYDVELEELKKSPKYTEIFMRYGAEPPPDN